MKNFFYKIQHLKKFKSSKNFNNLRIVHKILKFQNIVFQKKNIKKSNNKTIKDFQKVLRISKNWKNKKNQKVFFFKIKKKIQKSFFSLTFLEIKNQTKK